MAASFSILLSIWFLQKSFHVSPPVDKGLITAMILIDLKKAFDTIDHYILLQKL